MKSNRKAQNRKLLSMKELVKFMECISKAARDCGDSQDRERVRVIAWPIVRITSAVGVRGNRLTADRDERPWACKVGVHR
jgi:hypothetical protein